MNSPQKCTENKRIWYQITKRLESRSKHRHSLFWCSLHLLLLAIVLYNLYYTCPLYCWWLYSVELVLAALFGLCAIHNFVVYLRLNHFTNPIELTAHQFQLFGICTRDPNFKLKCSTPISSPNTSLNPSPLNLSSNSWLSSSVLSSYPNQDSRMSTSPMSPSSSYIDEDFDPIDDEASYKDYMNLSSRSLHIDYSGRTATPGVNNRCNTSFGLPLGTKSFSTMMNFSSTPMFSSFWSNGVSGGEFENRSRTQIYQTSPRSPNKLLDDSDSASSRTFSEHEVWLRLGINPSNLTKWTNNLKMWIHRTILLRVIKEIDAVNRSLQLHNVTDVQVGAVGLEKLKSMSQVTSIAHNIPSLCLLVQFLSVSSNQSYVVSRLKELAKNWYMSDFKWNSGGSVNSNSNKPWDSYLPTDSALIFHLMSVYLDTHEPAFSAKHFLCTPNAPKKRNSAATAAGVILYQSSVMPPHYQLVVGDHTYDLPKGRNNLFEGMLAFLHYIKSKEHGELDGLNLGPGGVNMLWIIEESSTTSSMSPKG